MLRLVSLLPCFIGALALAATARAEDKPCTARDGDKFYDLNPLKNNQDYEMKTPDGRDFVLNVCRSVARDTWNVESPSPDTAAGFVRKDHGDLIIGLTNTTVTVKNGSPVLVFSDGSPCPKSDNMKMSTVVRFVCEHSLFDAAGPAVGSSNTGAPQLIAQLPPDDESACAYVVEWKTQHACPAEEMSTAWRVVLIVAAVIFGVLLFYVIVGVLYRRFVLQLRGLEQLPRFTLPHIGDFFRFCRDALDDMWSRRSDPFDHYGSAWPGWRSRSSGGGGYGYEHMPVNREEEEAILGDEDESPLDEHGEDGANPWSGNNGNGRPLMDMDRQGVIRL